MCEEKKRRNSTPNFTKQTCWANTMGRSYTHMYIHHICTYFLHTRAMCSWLCYIWHAIFLCCLTILAGVLISINVRCVCCCYSGWLLAKVCVIVSRRNLQTFFIVKGPFKCASIMLALVINLTEKIKRNKI